MEATVAVAQSPSPSPFQVIDGGSARGSKEWAKRIRRQAKEVARDLDTGYLEMARLLYEIFDAPIDGDPTRGPIFKSWGFNTFSEYVEEELGMERRKAERLRAIWYTLEIQLVGLEADVRDRLVKLGISKLRTLVSVLDLTNARAWLELAERCSVPKLIASVQRAKEEAEIKRLQNQVETPATAQPEVTAEGGTAVTAGGSPTFADGSSEDDEDDGGSGDALQAPEEPEEISFEHFALYPAQHLNVKLALRRATELSGSDKKSHNLDLICMDFLANNDIIPKNVVASRAKFLAKMERIFGAKIIALDEQQQEVIYGVETLNRLGGREES